MRGSLAVLALVCVVIVALLVVNRRAEPLPSAADAVVIKKQAHTMGLLRNGAVLHEYRVALGRGGLQPKERAGDNRVPEGTYRIVGHNDHSAFHRALRIGYPTPAQVDAARKQGVQPGGDIMIHGIRNGLGWLGSLQREIDWTKGCVAVTDSEIDVIAKAVPDGTPVVITQ